MKAVIVAAYVLAIALTAWMFTGGQFDLEVYRVGARTWFTGGDLYGSPMLVDWLQSSYPFTYPPLAAIVFVPLGFSPMMLCGVVLIAVSGACLAVVVRLVMRDRNTAVVCAVSAAALLLDPLRSTMVAGQINLILMALVTMDCLVRDPRWPRGLLIGVAAAIKLTPAAFVLFFLLRRDYKAAATAGGSFVACGLVGFVLAPTASVRYWTELVFQSDRPGDPIYAGNQSLRGMLARFGLDSTPIWLAAVIVVLVLTVIGMRRLLSSDDVAGALVLNAAAALLVSPISWCHHWVWAVPALIVLAANRKWWPAGLVAVIFLVGPVEPVPNNFDRELHWTWWQQVVGNAYVWLALLALAAVVVVRGPLPARRGPLQISPLPCPTADPTRSGPSPRSQPAS